mmetsp:Transcript_1271/g.1621  ORF Transcript_1271/g.1621 Transcript_1271/m.1621 type:complete len:1749 (-) Transcript_1271:123-5369(-)
MSEIKNKIIPGELKTVKAQMETTRSFEKRLEKWLSSLTAEERSVALSFDDSDFISIVFHLARNSGLPSSQNPFPADYSNDGKTETCGDCLDSALLQSSDSWMKEVPLLEIEKLFLDYSKKNKATTSDSISMMNPEPHGKSSTSSTSIGPEKDGPYNNDASAESSQSDSANTIEFERIHTVNDGKGEDAIEVEKITKTPAAGEESPIVKSKELCRKASTVVLDSSILDDVRFIFPGISHLAKEYISNSVERTKEFKINQSPILSLNPDCLPQLMSMNLNRSNPPSDWLDVLRENANSTVPLWTLVMSRIYFGTVEAYYSCHEVDNFKDQTLPSSDKSCEKEEDAAGQCDIKAGEKHDQNNNRDSVKEVLPSDEVNGADAKCQNVESKENVKENSRFAESAVPTSLFSFPNILQKFAVTSELEELKAILDKDVSAEELPFFSVRYILDLDKPQLEKIDSVIKKVLKSALSRAVEAKYFDDHIFTPKPQEEILEIKKDSEEFLSVQDAQVNNTSGKKKRKKKKRKRKASNVDLPQGKEPLPAARKTEQVQKKDEGDKMKVLEETVPSPDAKKETSSTPTVDKIPTLPVANSFDTDRTAHTSKDSSAATDLVSFQRKEQEKQGTGIMVSHFEGVGPRCVVIPGSETPADNREKSTSSTKPDDDAGDDDDQWETVEIKVRGKNRNRNAEQRSFPGNNTPNGQTNSGNGRKVKAGRTAASRRKNAHRKIARDILSSVLDSVELEVKRNKKTEDRAQEEKRRRPPQAEKQGPAAAQQLKSGKSKALSMRDVVLRKPSVTGNAPALSQSKQKAPVNQDLETSETSDAFKKDKKTSNQTMTTYADQSTAQTLPETLSGASNTQLSIATEEVDNVSDKNTRAQPGSVVLLDGTSSVVETNESEPSSSKAATTAGTDSSPPPPLSTLLGPGNSNSASSSVASSLEAPHSLNHRHHHSSNGNENDVGYHLLDVCDRLSRDMNVFMARRALALTARRRERGALLAALQDTVSNIWAGRGNVEMYGSCATQLDLPSSDVDAVILGLDQIPDTIVDKSSASSASSTTKTEKNKKSSANEFDGSQEGNSFVHLRNQYARPSNSERVMILAAELERQPWAVQVKAIPTASVPVVKILADPSKIPGAVTSYGSGGDWMVQQHHMAAQAAAAAAGVNPPPQPQSGENTPFAKSAHHSQGPAQFPTHTPPPWRGADVMNGLFKVDITFEGPEHGGIGSTTFSTEAIRDSCNESGLPAEGTPIVQVLMVLKELLAQRRLNEPFSGGLSSYALLLLVIAVVKERKIIREEMERIERHRKLVAGENTVTATKKPEQGGKKNHSVRDTNPDGGKDSIIMNRSNDSSMIRKMLPNHLNSSHEGKPRCTNTDKSKEGSVAQEVKNKNSMKNGSSPKFSWASIARKNSSGASEKRPVNAPVPSTKSANQQDKPKQLPSKAASFAEAVSRKQEPQNQKSCTEGKRQVKRLETPRLESKIASDAGATSIAQASSKAQSEHVPSQKKPMKQVSKELTSAPKSKQPATTKEANRWEQSKCIQGSTPSQPDSNLTGIPSLFPQGSNDVLEVLCSGETTAGKLLMHFLLYYGELFDSRLAAIDVVGNYHQDTTSGRSELSAHSSPFVNRRSGGSIDPYTGMLTVDPIVVYDPWEGGRGNNVTRSCYAWSSIRWHFGQCYMTLSSAIERTGSSPATTSISSETSRKEIPAMSLVNEVNTENNDHQSKSKDTVANKSYNKSSNAGLQPPVDMVSPLLELLISF